MEGITLDELKEWLKIDSTDEDTNTLPSLISTSNLMILQGTGVNYSDVSSDETALNLYKTLQRFIITDLYENRTGSNNNSLVINLYAQLKIYKDKKDVATS